MKESTRIQIENMKNQTFGVEIEGNNITRQKAAQKAAEYFGTGRYEYTARRTDISPGAHGTRRVGNGNSRGMSALPDRTTRNARWSPQSSPTRTWSFCRGW